jgi:hypothetical protein
MCWVSWLSRLYGELAIHPKYQIYAEAPYSLN